MTPQQVQENLMPNSGFVVHKIENPSRELNVFTGEHLDCISGIETAGLECRHCCRNGRVGLFQFNEANRQAAGSDIPWDNGNAAKTQASRSSSIGITL